MKSISGIRHKKNDEGTTQHKTIKSVRTADIVKMINGAQEEDASVIPDVLKTDADNDQEEIIYFDEIEGIYYDQNFNQIEFNPEDYMIEYGEADYGGPMVPALAVK